MSTLNPEQELQFFKNRTVNISSKIQKLDTYIKNKENRLANRDKNTKWLQEYRRLSELETKIESELSLESIAYFDYHVQSQATIKQVKFELNKRFNDTNQVQSIPGSKHHASNKNSQNSNSSRDEFIRFLARQLENLEHDYQELYSDFQFEIANLITKGNHSSTQNNLHEESAIYEILEIPSKKNYNTNPYLNNNEMDQEKIHTLLLIQPKEMIHNTPPLQSSNIEHSFDLQRIIFEESIQKLVPPLQYESTEIRKQFIGLLFENERKEQVRHAQYQILKNSDLFEDLTSENIIYFHYLKSFKEFTTGRSDTNKSKSFLIQLHDEMKNRFNFRKLVYGPILTRNEYIPTLDSLKELNNLFEKRNKLKKNNREAKHTFLKQKENLIEKMKQTLQLTHEINQENEIRKFNLDQVHQKQTTLHNQLEILRKDLEEKDTLEREEKERFQKLQEERERLIEIERKKERKRIAQSIEQYHKQREELQKKKLEIEALQREKLEAEKRKIFPEMKARVLYRDQLIDEKRKKLQTRTNELKKEIEERERRLEALREQVRPHIDADFDRAIAPTESFLSNQDTESQIHTQFPTHGYSESTLLKDKRYKLQMKLQEAGLLHTQAARELINQMTDYSKMRADNLTTQQRTQQHI